MNLHQERIAYRIWNLLAGIGLGLIAILSLPVIFGDLGGERGLVNWFTIFIGTCLSVTLFWWLFIGRKQHVTALRGGLAGALGAIVAYPVVFLMNELILREVSATVGLATLPDRIVHALITALLALLFGGWFTVLLGGLVGGLLAFAQQRLLPIVGDDMAELAAAGTGRVSDFAHNRPVPTAVLAIVLLIVALILIVGSWVWFAPLATGSLAATPDPAGDYQTALARIQAWQAAEAQLPLNPDCQTRLLSHGRQTAKVVVYVHGFTNCPAQFDELGQQLFDAGYNVFVPRMPRHGMADRLTNELATLTAEELVAYADEAVDIAQGLGEEVIVVGLSGGGSVAGWMAQERSDVDSAIVIAPMFGILSIPPFAVRPTTTAALTVPNLFIWWDPATKDAIAGPQYAYPRYATEAVGQLLRLGRHVRDRAATAPPAAGRIVAVTNAVDPAVNNAVFAEIIARWEAAGYPVDTFEFTAEQDLPHDVVDPRQPDAQTGIVYPILIDLVDGAQPDSP